MQIKSSEIQLLDLPEEILLMIFNQVRSPFISQVSKRCQSLILTIFHQIYKTYKKEENFFFKKIIRTIQIQQPNQTSLQKVSHVYQTILANVYLWPDGKEKGAHVLAQYELFSSQGLIELTTWSYANEAPNLVKFYKRMADQLLEAQVFLKTLSQGEETRIEQANSIKKWMKTYPHLLRKITVLNLNELNLMILPRKIGYLINLKILNLCSNLMTTLPQEIGHLKNLEELNLKDNYLRDLSIITKNNHKLIKLNVESNQLETLPASINKLVHLQYLFLSTNRLQSLPQEIGELKNLQILTLSHNQLTTLPKELGNLEHLCNFQVSHNPLSTIPEEIYHASSRAIVDNLILLTVKIKNTFKKQANP
jgi:Leucine-rich repeat (LRR) protein